LNDCAVEYPRCALRPHRVLRTGVSHEMAVRRRAFPSENEEQTTYGLDRKHALVRRSVWQRGDSPSAAYVSSGVSRQGPKRVGPKDLQKNHGGLRGSGQTHRRTPQISNGAACWRMVIVWATEFGALLAGGANGHDHHRWTSIWMAGGGLTRHSPRRNRRVRFPRRRESPLRHRRHATVLRWA
jgi:hypothetical protein